MLKTWLGVLRHDTASSRPERHRSKDEAGDGARKERVGIHCGVAMWLEQARGVPPCCGVGHGDEDSPVDIYHVSQDVIGNIAR